jgi:hypothetical protein
MRNSFSVQFPPQNNDITYIFNIQLRGTIYNSYST